MGFPIVHAKIASKIYKMYLTACKERVSDSPGLVDFAIGLVDSVIN